MFCDLGLISRPSPSVSLVIVLLSGRAAGGSSGKLPDFPCNLSEYPCAALSNRVLCSSARSCLPQSRWCWRAEKRWYVFINPSSGHEFREFKSSAVSWHCCGEKLFWGRRGFAFVGMKCASGSWLDSVMSSPRSGMVISFRMPVLDNGTTFPGSIPYALHTRKWSFLYSMLEITLTPSSSHLLVEGMLEGLLMLHGLQVSRQKTTLQLPFPAQSRCYYRHWFKWIFHMRFDRGAFRSQAPLPPCGSEKSMRRTRRRLVISLASSHWLDLYLYFPRMHLACREVYLERFLLEFWMWSQQYRTLPECFRR